jgi:GDPmannose 4,6-dehydratase
VPGEIIDNNGLYIAPNSWSRAKFTVDNMKEYRIMDNNIIKTLVNYGIKYWRKTMETKTALITGITGQDGSFLAELLLDKGYDVHGLIRRLSKPNLGNIEHIIDDIHLIDGDLSDQSSIINAVTKSCPDELYNLAAQSFVATSWQQAEYTCNISGFGAFRVYDASRMVGKYIKGEDPKHNIKIYQASSSEMYGDSPAPQNELTQFNPRSPYGAAKVFAHNMAKVYRDSYNMFITCGILFNHESQRRGIEFVSMKIANAAARIDAGLQDKLKLGNLDAKRDWGYTKDYVEAMYLMMQQEKPDNFVIASGENHTIREFVDEAFSHVGLKWHDYVEIDKSLFRPAEIDDLRGDYSKAEKTFGWKPKTSFKELIHIMVDSEINKITGTK